MFSKDVNLFVQCPLKKQKKSNPKLSFCGKDFTIQLLLGLKSTPFSAFGKPVVGQQL